MTGWAKQQRNGFTLLELLLAMAILGVVVFFVINLTSSVRHGGKVGETKQRMEIIAAKMQEYYRHQGNLPVPVGASAGNPLIGAVPVDLLNLETKYTLDGFGQRIVYRVITRDDTLTGPTDIIALTVDDVDNMGGVLISGGGNQSISPGTVNDATRTYTTTSDDIVFPVNLTREATEIALDEVRELQRRVNQFDNLFRGENRCIYLTDDYTDDTNYDRPDVNIDACPPLFSNMDLGYEWENDPNCGTASLDQIEDAGADASEWFAPPTGVGGAYGCDNYRFDRQNDFEGAFGALTGDHAALKFIVGYYALGNNYLLDPWGNPYQWGCARIVCDDNGYHTFDPRYRKFFSTGPNGLVDDGPDGTGYAAYTTRADIIIDDDIIP